MECLVMAAIVGAPALAMLGVALIGRAVYGGRKPPSQFDGLF